jgi:transposase
LFVPATPELRLPEDHFVRSLRGLVEDVLGVELRSRCVHWGGFPYDPVAMFSILIYALLQGERSSRRIERLCQYDTRFWYLSNGTKPDHTTIARFRRNLDKEGGLDELFSLVARHAGASGLVKGKSLVVDGTKMPTSGSQWRKYLNAAETEDASDEESAPPEKPPPRNRRGPKKQKEKECSRPFKAPSDKDARTMKTTHGEYVNGFNMQLGVDGESGIVLGALVTNQAHDSSVLGSVLEASRQYSGVRHKRVVADRGYDSAFNLSEVERLGAKSYICPKAPAAQPFTPDEAGVLRCLAGHAATQTKTTKDGIPYLTYRVSQCRLCALREPCGKTSQGHQREMNVRNDEHLKRNRHNRRRCQSAAGKRQLRIRGQTVELANARIKRDLRMTRLHLKGLDGARIELLIACLTLNLQTILRKAGPIKHACRVLYIALKALVCRSDVRSRHIPSPLAQA